MILILGQGFVAHEFTHFYGERARLSTHRVEDYSALLAHLKEEAPEVLINCVGKTGRPNVDWCEDHKLETIFANVTVPLMLARACEELGIRLVHIGSGCVYSGDNDGRGFSEDDAPNFSGSFYSRTKAWSEAMLNEFSVLQLRLRMPLIGRPDERNFITKIARYPKVISVANSISVFPDFLEAAAGLIDQRATGIFNMTNPGAIDHREILEMYQELVDPSFKPVFMNLEELGQVTKAARSNCVLNVEKLAEHGVQMRPVKEAVRSALLEYSKHML